MHWSESHVNHAQRTDDAALDRRFGWRMNWRFFAKENEYEPVVLKSLRRVTPKYPHFFKLLSFLCHFN